VDLCVNDIVKPNRLIKSVSWLDHNITERLDTYNRGIVVRIYNDGYGPIAIVSWSRGSLWQWDRFTRFDDAKMHPDRIIRMNPIDVVFDLLDHIQHVNRIKHFKDDIKRVADR